MQKQEALLLKLTEYVNSMKETINRGGNIQWNLLKFQQKQWMMQSQRH